MRIDGVFHTRLDELHRIKQAQTKLQIMGKLITLPNDDATLHFSLENI
jgi:hypothetical protein